MSTTIATTGLKAYNDSIKHNVPQIVDELRSALGAKLVAYIAGVTETRTVREWGRDRPPALTDRCRASATDSPDRDADRSERG